MGIMTILFQIFSTVYVFLCKDLDLVSINTLFPSLPVPCVSLHVCVCVCEREGKISQSVDGDELYRGRGEDVIFF